MKWMKVVTPRKQPRKGNYSSWKPQVADDCSHRCVYCAISEARYGGLDNFHVDHFRPKTLFESIENSIHNLFLACAICNRFKSDDWPSEPSHDNSSPAYPDPSVHEYSALFDLDPNTHKVSGKYVASRYVEERLYLNRPQLIMERRQSAIEECFTAFRLFVERTLEANSTISENTVLMKEIIKRFISISNLTAKLGSCPPYELSQIRRAKTPPLGRRKSHRTGRLAK